MLRLISLFLLILFLNTNLMAIDKKPYHHVSDGTFRNPEGSPKRDPSVKWSYKIFNEEREKIKIDFPKDHVIPRNEVLKNLQDNEKEDFITWIGHATFLIKLGDTTIITDPLFSKNTGPLMFGPKRYVDPAIKLKDVPKTDLLLLTHNHYDHLDASAIRNFPHKNAKVLLPLKLSKYFKRYRDVNELDWYEKIKINDGKIHHVVAITEKGKGVRIYIDNVLSLNNTTNAKGGLVKDSDGWTPAVGANLQQHINLSKSLEGEFIPMQDELRVYSKANFVPNWANQSYSGIYRKTSNPTESLLIASREGNLEKVKELLDSGLDPDSTSRNSYTALAYASVAGHLDIMKLLISKKADVNKASRFKKVPLNVTAGSSNIEGAKLLISSGAKLNAVNNNGSSIVHEAAFWGQPKMMEFLLKDKGLSANLRANNGGTPLHWAMWQMRRGFTKYNQGYLDCIKLLLKHGANTELRAGNQGTAKEMAKNRGLDEVLALFESK